MNTMLTRAELRQQIERFAAGELSSKRLAAWAFDQFCDQQEELLDYEPAYAETIAAVLDELIWSDDQRFALGGDAALALIERLDMAAPDANVEIEADDDFE